MTPPDKAKDIYDKMKGFRVKNTHRKKCALVAVDLLIEYASTNLGARYWESVKFEIEKL